MTGGPEKYKLEEVFVTEGVPEFTFVKPPNYNDILLDVRRTGKPVIIEGQSGTGKTTCIKRVISELGAEDGTVYLTARNPANQDRIAALVANRPTGNYVIDDFHRLPAEIQMRLANMAKESAELGNDSTLPKLIIIGINEVGAALIQLVPDIAKRTGIHRIAPGTERDIADLVQRGSEKLNISIENSQSVFAETKGDYWLAQQLCQTICGAAGVVETADLQTSVPFDVAAVRRRVVDRLRHNYYMAVKEFCRGQRFRPSNDPYYRLLKVVGEQETSVIDLNGLANANDEVRGSINNLKVRRLSVLLETKPQVAPHFYYNNETKIFAIEDPALFYFLKHLDWTELRKDCGFREDSRSYDFEVAISFAGEYRELARQIYNSLEMLDVPVFFDEAFETNFLGSTWSKHLKDIFSNGSRYVVCLLEKHHLEKIWPTFERDLFAPRVVEGAIIPVYLDSTVFPGIPKDLVGIKFQFDPSDENWRKMVDEEIVMKIIDRIS